MNTLARLQDIFDSLFLDPIELNLDLTASQVEEWDSLMQVNIIVAVEKHFGITFALGEVELTQDVGEFIELIDRHQRAKS